MRESPREHPRDEFDVDYPAGARRGAHRTATPVVLEQLPWLLAALASVVVLVLVVVWATGGGAPTSPLGALTGDPTATDPATSDPATSDPAATTAPPDPATTTAPPATSAPPATTEPPAPTADRSIEVVVLNGTTTGGLAAATGEELEGLGWTVGELGNADDRPVTQTVVLFDAPENEATAAAVASDLGVQARLDDGASSAVVVVVGEDRA